jgi:hypothetical protein
MENISIPVLFKLLRNKTSKPYVEIVQRKKSLTELRYGKNMPFNVKIIEYSW